ncbi:urea hydro-lyase/cyanamide hydratase [Myriangium duriaei CBS 260.36]|uniref:Urea hydro-lyase/cyanamide hydratase n=1 Tax=Myriangium duriaei CBS 260.36 TaxID=1168546 RepID=A0A9P4J5Z0_9PEZI|nr:urea hydro-lyase/cyanamide hydratase [Myriangium duriaei CBS 260.36]
MSDSTTTYGFTAFPADQSKTPPSTSEPSPVSPDDIPLPSTPLAKRILSYARSKLPEKTINHSLRVYTYGHAIARECFPKFNLTPGSKLDETWFLTAMLHDIGTSPEFLSSTKLSFEFWGGYHALEILQDGDSKAPKEQAESVAEAIIRHQDVQDKGSITLVTRLIHMGTLLDNIGAGNELVHPQTIEKVNEKYDRKGWSGCFIDTVKEEKNLKPWAMVSRIEGFENEIEKNGKGLMAKWD